MALRALARGSGARGADRPDLGAELARHGVRACAATSPPARRGDLREVPRGRGGGGARARADEDDVHVLRRRLPARPERRPGDEADRQVTLEARVRLERGQPLRQGPICVQLRPPSGPPDRAVDPARTRAAADDVEPSPRSPPTGSGGDGAPFPAARGGAQLGPADERGELPDPEARPDGAEDAFVHSCEAT